MTKRRVPVLSIVLYALAGLLVLYTIWGVSESVSYINEAVAAGQLVVQGNGYTIVNFYMSNCSQYALFAVILFTLGWILQYFSRCKTERPDSDREPSCTCENENAVCGDTCDAAEDSTENK